MFTRLLVLLVLATMLGACVRKVTMAPINAPPRDAAAYQARRNAVALPIITYHRITAEATSQMAISPALFTRHMSYLKDNGYTPITLDEWYVALAYGLDLPEKLAGVGK